MNRRSPKLMALLAHLSNIRATLEGLAAMTPESHLAHVRAIEEQVNASMMALLAEVTATEPS